MPTVTAGPKSSGRNSGSKVPKVVPVGSKVPPFTCAVEILLPLVVAVPAATVRLLMVLVLLKFTVAVPWTVAEYQRCRPRRLW